MGAFNTVIANCTCPVCGQAGTFECQFKYASTWQHHYKIGDKVIWGKNDRGKKTTEIVIEVLGGPCSQCNADNLLGEMMLHGDRIVRVTFFRRQADVGTRVSLHTEDPRSAQ
jgi:hypothetical protein